LVSSGLAGATRVTRLTDAVALMDAACDPDDAAASGASDTKRAFSATATRPRDGC
jgi:hypothetical protein